MLLEWLERFGYLTSDDVTRIRDGATELLQGAIGLLKHRLDLPDDLPADTLMEAPRCGCPDILPLTAEPVRWAQAGFDLPRAKLPSGGDRAAVGAG